MSLDEDYLEQLRGAFDRYLAAVVRPLLMQNRDLKTALQAERLRNADLQATLDASPKP